MSCRPPSAGSSGGSTAAGWLLLVLMPGSNIVCLMVGHRRMPPWTFLPLITAGIILKLGVLWVGGQLFEDQITTLLDLIEHYQWWVVAALFAITFAQSAKRVRRVCPGGRAGDRAPGRTV